MGLTKPRAAQIFNLDYKQSTRVVTATNITLSGGAPNAVDGVNLSLGDRVLVTGQTTGSQNGLYQVTTLGSGANGTWARTSDGNENGEIEAGMIVMVTEGTIYADTQWKLITDDPIVIGTTSLMFTQNYMANSISSGTSNVVVNSNANVTISSAGTANVLTVSNTGAFVTGVVSATGNVTGNYILGNGASLTGVITSVANINNGTSNVTVVSSGGNVTVGVGGTGNVVVFATTGEYVSGLLSVTGNITSGNISATNHTGTNVSVTGTVTAASTVGGVITGTSTSVTGTQTAASTVGGVITGSSVSVTGTATAASTVGGVITGTSVSTTGNITTAATANISTGNLSVSGNIASGNISATNHTGTNVSVTGTVTAASTVGGVITGSSASVTGTVTGASVVGGVITGTSLSTSGNVTGGNIRTVGQVSATGNITTDTFFVGNGTYLTGISAAISVTKIENGNSNVWVNTPGGDVTVTAGGVSNVAVFSTGSLTLRGAFGTPKTISANIVVATNINAMLIGPLVFGDGYNLTVPDSSTVYVYAP